MQNIKTVFWDWNGTLWDDVDQWFIAAKAAYKHAQVPEEITLERLRDAFDVPVQDVIYALGAPRNLPQDNHDRLLKTFTDVLGKHEHLAKVREGAGEALTFFAQYEVENFLVSNHPIPLLKKELEKGDLAEFFRTICGNDNHDQVYTKGTKAERIQKHLKEALIAPTQAFIIADTREEVRIAKQFGMTSIALTGGYNSEQALRSVEPDYLVHHLSDIPKIFCGRSLA